MKINRFFVAIAILLISTTFFCSCSTAFYNSIAYGTKKAICYPLDPDDILSDAKLKEYVKNALDYKLHRFFELFESPND